MLHMPTPMLILSPGKSYGDFQALIGGMATGGVKTWGSQLATTAGKFRTTAEDPGVGIMTGSPWLNYMSRFTSVAKLIQHGLPSEAAYLEQSALGLEIYYEIVSLGSRSSFTNVSRNGFTSDGSETAATAYNCVDLLAWVGGQAIRMRPNLGQGPLPYSDW